MSALVARLRELASESAPEGRVETELVNLARVVLGQRHEIAELAKRLYKLELRHRASVDREARRSGGV